jgi:hypothetical protein
MVVSRARQPANAKVFDPAQESSIFSGRAIESGGSDFLRLQQKMRAFEFFRGMTEIADMTGGS